MSILIKGMDMPREGECQAFIIHSDGSISVNLNSTSYRAVEVPTPHGRLIDADILPEQFAYTDNNFEMTLEYAPTVIEAEE